MRSSIDDELPPINVLPKLVPSVNVEVTGTNGIKNAESIDRKIIVIMTLDITVLLFPFIVSLTHYPLYFFLYIKRNMIQ
jgi:fructose-specific phosphotransferase system component IIB